MFFSTSVADDRAFHLGRRVLGDFDVCLDGRQHGHAAHVSKLQRASGIHGRKQILDGQRIWIAYLDQPRNLAMNGQQLVCKRRGAAGGDGTAGHQAVAGPVGLDAAVTGAVGPGIDPQDSHARDASISFSSMSKFDHT